MGTGLTGRSILLTACVAAILRSGGHASAAGQRIERHFAVKSRPVVVIQNVANGRIEVKSSKNPEVAVIASQTSNKITLDMEQAGHRIDIIANIADAAAQAAELETSRQHTVTDESELDVKPA